MENHYRFLTGLFAGAAFISCQQNEPQPPDILLFIADDMTWHDCEPYHQPQFQLVHTPHIAKIAAEGIAFDNMFTSTAMCGPSRQQLYTGLFPVNSGSYPNHSRVFDSIVSIATHFKDIGYRVAIIGKQHYGPAESFPFDYLGGRNSDREPGPDILLEDAWEYINRDKSKPYLLIVATNQPHSPWNRGDANRYPPDSVSLPSYMVSTPATRQNISGYYAEITYADSLVGVCLKMVEDYGNRDNTIVAFTSEQGSAFPFGKWTLYNTGLKTAFVMQWPRVIKPGTRTDVLTQYVDVLPTLWQAAGQNPDVLKGNRDGNKEIDGKSFYHILKGEQVEIRQWAYGVHTTRGINMGSDYFPKRSVHNKEYKLIWNENYTSPFYCARSYPGSAMYEEWLVASSGDPGFHQHVVRYRTKPEFELYHLVNDPYEMNNLADIEDYWPVKELLHAELLRWMERQGDKGMETERVALTRFRGDSLNWKPYRGQFYAEDEN
jgi:N-sulfoglucosamine sulfohydrolase